jgi:hypothetical protein
MVNLLAARRRLLLALALGMALPSFGQTTFTWFDINPSQSNDSNNGASAGRINHVGAASDLSKVYAATEWGGLYQSFDAGNTWVKINTFSPSATWDVKVDPSNSARIYATSFFDGRVNPQSGISISTDSGLTWTAVPFAKFNQLTCSAVPNNEPSGWQIAINPNTNSTVFVGTSCGLARSLDSGQNWTFIDPSPADNAEQVFAVIAHDKQTVDVISQNGFFRSTDNGATWSAALAPGPAPVAGNSGPVDSLAVSPAESYVLLAADTQNPPGVLPGNDIRESDDGGVTWPTSLTPPTISGGLNAQGRIPFVRTNQLSTSSQFDVWFGDINLFKATATTPSPPAKGGTQRTPQNSWVSVQSNAHWDVGDVFFDPRFGAGACPSFFTSDGGVFLNTDPNNPSCQSPNWVQPTITPHATWLWGFDGVRLSPGVHGLTYGLQDDGGYAATNVAEGHNPPAPNWNNDVCCDIFNNTEGAGKIVDAEGAFRPPARAFQLFLRNRDGSNGNAISSASYPSASPLSVFTNGQEYVPSGTTGYVLNMLFCPPPPAPGIPPPPCTGDVYFTNDITAGTIAWTSLNSPTDPTSATGNIRVAVLNGQTNVFYHTGNGDPESQGAIYRSALAQPSAPGANWTKLPLPAGITSVTAYDVDPTNGNHIIVSGINANNIFQIFLTQNFGANWTELTSLENLMVGIGAAGGAAVFVNRANQGKTTGFLSFGTYWQPSLFKFDPLEPNTIVAGAIDAGAFLSLNNGTNWQAISNNINPNSTTPSITTPIFAYFSPGRFAGTTNAFDVWVGTRGAGVRKVVLETPVNP